MGVSPIRQEGNDKMNVKMQCLMNDERGNSLDGGEPHPSER